MNLVLPRLGVIACMAGLCNSGALAQHKKVAWGAESDFNSEYLWQGIVVDGGPVSETSASIDAF